MVEIEPESEEQHDPVEAFMSLDRWPSSPPYTTVDEGPSPYPAETYLAGFVIANVVGLRYYEGTISGREMVGLVREELNPHDPNAIKVLNMRSVQVGHLERSAAAVLSPLIDRGLITVEGSYFELLLNFVRVSSYIFEFIF